MENNRAQWGSKIGFILAAAGSAVGLGNIWKFPGKAFEGGGGAYILIYLAIVVLIGFPVMLSELTIGRAAQANAIDSFHKLGYRGFKWVGVTGVAVAFIVTSYYCHVGGWVLRYVVSYITEAQTVYADPLGYFYGLLGYNAATGETWFPLTAILFAAVFMAVNAVIIIKGVEGGIEKFNKVGMPALFIILIVLLARTITLDGAQVGFAYMLCRVLHYGGADGLCRSTRLFLRPARLQRRDGRDMVPADRHSLCRGLYGSQRRHHHQGR